MSDPAIPTDLSAYWQQQIDQWSRSDQSQKTFCQANSLSYHRFLYWRGKFKKGSRHQKPKQAGGGFATVDYRQDLNSGLTLSLPNGLMLRGICAENVSVVRQLLEQL